MKINRVGSSRVVSTFPAHPNIQDTSSVSLFVASDSLSGWSPTTQLFVDQTNTFEGHSTLKFDHQVSQGSPFSTYTLPATVNLTTRDYLELNFFLYDPDDVVKVGAMRMYSNATDYFLCALDKHIEPLYGTKMGWRKVRIYKNQFTVGVGSPTWTTITKMFLSLTVPVSNVAYISIGRVEAVSVDKATLCIDFDDGRISSYDNALPIMRKYNLRGNYYVITDWVGDAGFVNWKQIREFHDAGWMIGNHTHNHLNLSPLTREQVITEFDTSQRILREQGYYVGSYFLSAPQGGWSAIAEEEALERFIYCRLFRLTPRFDVQPINDNLYSAYESIENTHTLAQAKAIIDEIILHKTSHNMTFHDIGATVTGQYDWPTVDFDSLCAYIAQKRDEGVLKVVTAAEKILQYKGQDTEHNGQHSVLSNDMGVPVILRLNRS